MKQPVEAKPDGRCVALLLCPEGQTKGQSKGSLSEFQRGELKDHRRSRLLLVCLCKQTGRIKSWTQSSLFNNDEGDLKEKNHGLRKITMLSIGYRNCSCSCLESLFSFES